MKIGAYLFFTGYWLPVNSPCVERIHEIGSLEATSDVKKRAVKR